MKVILVQDVEKLGKKYDVKEVKAGYARNFLMPNNLVKVADKKALAWLALQKEIQLKKEEEEMKGVQDFASKLDGLELVIPIKIGKENQVFEPINNQRIAEQLKESGLEIKKSQIIMDGPIKEPGEHSIKVKLDHNLESEIRIIATEEKDH